MARTKDYDSQRIVNSVRSQLQMQCSNDECKTNKIIGLRDTRVTPRITKREDSSTRSKLSIFVTQFEAKVCTEGEIANACKSVRMSRRDDIRSRSPAIKND